MTGPKPTPTPQPRRATREPEAIDIRPLAVYTLREVCRIMRVSDATCRRAIRNGSLRMTRIGRAYRVLGRDLLASLDGGAA